jgi:hypothetical protein
MRKKATTSMACFLRAYHDRCQCLRILIRIRVRLIPFHPVLGFHNAIEVLDVPYIISTMFQFGYEGRGRLCLENLRFLEMMTGVGSVSPAIWAYAAMKFFSTTRIPFTAIRFCSDTRRRSRA